jgi:hypothetical protein
MQKMENWLKKDKGYIASLNIQYPIANSQDDCCSAEPRG